MTEFGYPDGIRVATDSRNRDTMITFQKDDGEDVAVRLTSTTLPTFVAQLHEKLGGSSITPVSLSQVRPGTAIRVSSVSTKRLPNGALRLVLTAELENRVVQIPLEVSAAEWVHMKKEMEG